MSSGVGVVLLRVGTVERDSDRAVAPISVIIPFSLHDFGGLSSTNSPYIKESTVLEAIIAAEFSHASALAVRVG